MLGSFVYLYSSRTTLIYGVLIAQGMVYGLLSLMYFRSLVQI